MKKANIMWIVSKIKVSRLHNNQNLCILFISVWFMPKKDQ